VFASEKVSPLYIARVGAFNGVDLNMLMTSAVLSPSVGASCAMRISSRSGIDGLLG
jgi:hypothetical protein